MGNYDCRLIGWYEAAVTGTLKPPLATVKSQFKNCEFQDTSGRTGGILWKSHYNKQLRSLSITNNLRLRSTPQR